MYKVVIYNKGKRVRVIKEYVYYKNALIKYNKVLEDNIVFFPKESTWDGKKTDYELLLIAPPKNKTIHNIRNEFGALITIKPKGNFSIKKIEPYYVEENFTDRLSGEKLDFKVLIKRLVKNAKYSPVIYVLNNKLYVEYFDHDAIELYVLKNKEDSYRLCDTIRKFVITNHIHGFLFFNNPTLDSKNRIYDLLYNDYGVSKDYMYKVSTR